VGRGVTAVEQPCRRFVGKTVLTTGGAQGIGKTIARWFAREGANLALNDIRKPELDVTVQELRSYGQRVEGYVYDVSKAADVRGMVDAVLRDFGKIDILVNNAGIALPTPFFELSEQEWDRLLNINLKSAFLVSQSVLKHMASRASGKVIMVSSISGKTGGVATGIHYDISKAGLIVMARRLAREFGSLGITVNAVAPSFADTAMLKDLNLDSVEKKKATANLNVIKRLATPEDVANVVLFLASDTSSFITGETINVNGGRLMD
jgi:3-oxoacyl-[acyl-carrier protein] reductase